MIPEDEQDLRELQGELVGAVGSPWEPKCVAQMFATRADEPFVFTMQTWIDLEACQSPLLLGRLPEADEALQRFREAFAAFGHTATTPWNCSAEDLIVIGTRMLAEIHAGFGMRQRLTSPAADSSPSSENGQGEWLPIMACLVSQIGLSVAEARTLPVGQAFALIAGHRCNQGWSVAGETYRMREVPDHG